MKIKSIAACAYPNNSKHFNLFFILLMPYNLLHCTTTEQFDFKL